MGERDDIGRLSEAWGVGSSTAAWALLSDALSDARESAPNLGNHAAVVLGASIRILTRHGLWGSSGCARCNAGQGQGQDEELGGQPGTGPDQTAR